MSEKRAELHTKIHTLVRKLDNLNSDHRKLYLIAGEISESIDNIMKVFDNAQKGNDFKRDTYSLLDTIRKASDVNPSIKLNVEALNSIIQLGTKIKEHIDWAYAPQRGGNVYNFVQKIDIGLQTGTGTLIQYDKIAEGLKGKIVLTVGHNYLDMPNLYSKNEMEDNADGKPFEYCELSGIETAYEEPKNRSNNFTVSNMRFNGQKIKRIYAQTGRDIAIFILEDKSALGDGVIIKRALQATDLSSRNFYTIGYGGYNYMENIEFGKKKATIKSNIHIVDGDIYADPKLPNFRVLSCASGDSGSPIIYSPNEENNTIIGIFASSGNDSSYLNDSLFNWIKAVCEKELQLQ